MLSLRCILRPRSWIAQKDIVYLIQTTFASESQYALGRYQSGGMKKKAYTLAVSCLEPMISSCICPREI